MAGRGLEDRLVASGALRRETVQMARRRQKVYGGGLDTVLLEMGLVDEGTLWALLVEDTGFAPLPPALLDGPVMAPQMLLGATEARRLGAFAFESEGGDTGHAQAIARPGFDQQALGAILGTQPVQVFIVPEVRFEALVGAYYRQSIPPRFVSLLGRLMSPLQLSRWSAMRAPRQMLPAPPVDVGPRFAPMPVVAARALAPAPETYAAPLPTRDETPEPLATPSSVEHPPSAPASAPVALDEAVAVAHTEQPASPEIPSVVPSHRDDLMAALTWLSELDGGPRALAVSEAIGSHWPAKDIFGRLAQLARRGENVAAAALPLLATLPNLEFLAGCLATGSTRDRTWASTALGLCLKGRVPQQQGTPTAGKPAPSLFALEPAAAQRITHLLCERVLSDPEPQVRAAAARGLRGFATHPAVLALTTRLAALVADPSALDPGRAGAGILLGELRSDIPQALEGLIAGTGAKSQPVADTCHAALVRITGTDPGHGRAGWRRWWRRNNTQSRAAWLVAALEGRRPNMRLLAANELEDQTGLTLGFHFDLMPGPRKAAVARWKRWLADTRPP